MGINGVKHWKMSLALVGGIEPDSFECPCEPKETEHGLMIYRDNGAYSVIYHENIKWYTVTPVFEG